MNECNFMQWVSIVAPLGTMMMLLYNRIERSDETRDELHKSYCELKNLTMERLNKNENGDKK